MILIEDTQLDDQVSKIGNKKNGGEPIVVVQAKDEEQVVEKASVVPLEGDVLVEFLLQQFL